MRAALILALAGLVSAGALAQDISGRLALCTGCHGADGNSQIENIPSLAGQPAFFVMNQLFLMREGVRKVDAMASFVKDLKDPEMQALAKHFAGLAPKVSGEKIDPELAKRGEALAASKRCASCHLPSLAGIDQMPRVAKQRLDYLVYAMKALRDDKRSGADTTMTAVLVGLSDADITALAHYGASR